MKLRALASTLLLTGTLACTKTPTAPEPAPPEVAIPEPEPEGTEACLEAPTAPPFAALYRFEGTERTYFRISERQAGFADEHGIELYEHTPEGLMVHRFAGFDAPATRAAADRPDWAAITRGMVASMEMAPGTLGLEPSRCMEMQPIGGTLDGTPMFGRLIPTLGIVEHLESEDGKVRLHLVQFVDATPFVQLAQQVVGDAP